MTDKQILEDAKESTPSSHWNALGTVDPHKGRYDGERAELALGKYSDDELANGAFMNYDNVLSIQDMLNPKEGQHMPIVWMTAVKDRIRWLSRKLEAELTKARAIPDGYVLVPIEPTDEMLRCALAVEMPSTYKEFLRYPLNGPKNEEENEKRILMMKNKYTAMIKASQQERN